MASVSYPTRHSTARRLQLRPWIGTLLSAVLLASCGAELTAPTSSEADSMARAPEAPPIAYEAGKAADTASQVAETVATTDSAPQAMPQLVKRAELNLVVDSIEETVDQVTAIAKAQQGDLLNLQDQIPQNSGSRHTATLQIRVPQARLDATMEELSALGTVQRQSIMAEDVSNQLVDFQARLRNLRKTEEMLLEIMDRSGSMPEVLQVAHELSTVRASIEQIDAQLKDLQRQVAYSTIGITLEAAIAEVPTQRALGEQISETWQQATHSVQTVTVGLMKLGLWLIAYSPYLLIIAIALGLGLRLRRRHPAPAEESRSEA